jgi:hypothetical protein
MELVLSELAQLYRVAPVPEVGAQERDGKSFEAIADGRRSWRLSMGSRLLEI